MAQCAMAQCTRDTGHATAHASAHSPSQPSADGPSVHHPSAAEAATKSAAEAATKSAAEAATTSAAEAAAGWADPGGRAFSALPPAVDPAFFALPPAVDPAFFALPPAVDPAFFCCRRADPGGPVACWRYGAVEMPEELQKVLLNRADPCGRGRRVPSSMRDGSMRDGSMHARHRTRHGARERAFAESAKRRWPLGPPPVSR